MIELLADTAGSGMTISIANILAGLGIGGVLVAIVNALANRKTKDAEAENISVSTQTLLSELIDTSTATLRQSVEDQKETITNQKVRIEALETMIEEFRRELDESVLIQRLRDAEHDNIYLRGRMKTLLGRIDALKEENERLIEELGKNSSSSLSRGDISGRPSGYGSQGSEPD